MTTTIINKNKKPNVPNSTDKGNVIRNVPHLRFPEFEGEWEKCKLGDKCDLLCGYAFDGKNIVEQGTYLLMRGINITEGIIRHSSELDRYYTGSVNNLAKYKLTTGDLVIGMDGSKVGRNSAIVSLTENGSYLVQRVCRIKSCIGNDFILQLVNNHKFHKYVDMVKTSSAIPHISLKDIQNFPIAVPSIQKEADKISRLFHLLDERIATQNKIIEDLKKLKSAISKKLLCNDKWTTYKIQDIAEIGRGRVISSVEIDRQKNPLYPVYSSQTSNNGIMGYWDNYMFDGEYITWTTDGANAGTVFYRKGKFNCTNVCGTLKIQPKFDCYFVSLVLQQATQKYVSSNLANPKLMNNTMASIKIRMPNIETQKQLSKVFQALDGCLLIHQRTCEMYLKEKQYLLRQMFI